MIERVELEEKTRKRIRTEEIMTMLPYILRGGMRGGEDFYSNNGYNF